MMQQLNQKHPDDYLLAMRVLFAPIGLMIVFWAVIPESPWWLVRKGRREQAMKSLKRLYGNIEEYDFEEEYGIIERTIAHEHAMLNNQPRFIDVFKGLNLVSPRPWTWSVVARLTVTAPYPFSHDSRRVPAVRGLDHHQHLLHLYVRSSHDDYPC